MRRLSDTIEVMPASAIPLRPINLRQNPHRHDPRRRRIYSFLVYKGYIEDRMWIHTPFRKKISLADWMWVCENLDHRMYQLIPGVLIRFPTHFKTIRQLPATVADAIARLRSGATDGPEFFGYPFSLLRSWMHFQPIDRRAHRVIGSLLRVRLNPSATRKLDLFTAGQSLTKTEAIHRAIDKL